MSQATTSSQTALTSARAPDILSDTSPDTSSDVAAAISDVLAAHNAISLASTGGEFSPWVLGAYFAHHGHALYLGLENSGKTMANLRLNPNVSFLVTSGDAQKDFVQGQATATFLTSADATSAEALIKAKMPWFQLYTPSTFVRLDVTRFWISSLARHWFPAKQLTPTTAVAL